MNIISEKKDQQRNGPALKNQQEEGRDLVISSICKQVWTWKYVIILKTMENPPAQGVRNCKYTAIFRSICLFRDRLYLGYRGGLASCHLEDMFVGTRRLGSGINVCGGLFSFYPGLPFHSRLDMKVVLPVFPNTSLADSIFSYGKKSYPGACNLTQELQGKRFRVSVFARQEQSSQHSLYSFPWQNNNAFLTLLLQPPFQLGHEKLQHNRCKFVLLLIFVTFLFNVGVKNFQVSEAKATWHRIES